MISDLLEEGAGALSGALANFGFDVAEVPVDVADDHITNDAGLAAELLGFGAHVEFGDHVVLIFCQRRSV